MMKQELFWLQAFLFGASCIAGLIITRKRKLHRLHLHVLSSKPFDFGKYFGVDIGGTLAKMVYFQPSKSSSITDFTQERLYLSNLDEYILNLKSSDGSRTAERDERLELHVDALGGTLHFCSFQTSRMENIVETIRNRFFHRYIRTISCTGGGAYKFSRLFEDTLGIFIQKADEMDALIQGLNFVLRYAKNECYTFKNVSLDAQGLGEATKKLMPMPTNHHEIYPFLLVNIGSGVSILKVTSETQYERVSGTSLGGGTFWGLCRTLSKFRSFEEAMDASVEGNSSSVDMTVGDIYGRGYDQFNLKSSTIASSFGKIGMKAEARSNVRDEDIARALLVMITQNIGHVAYLNARRVDTKRIYFCGNFLRRNEIASRQLAHAIDFWSKSEMEAQFFHHEGFFGALGAFLTQFPNKSMMKTFVKDNKKHHQ